MSTILTNKFAFLCYENLSNMKRLLILLLLSPFYSAAQEKTLLAEGVSPGLYVTHKVAAKENYYSIGRIYNISPKEIAPFNNLQLESGLSIGQVIKVPLTNINFFQGGTAGADEVFVPVHHIVKNKEGLNQVVLHHIDLPLETLKQWNNIKGDAVKKGTRLIVGYLKVKKADSYLAKNGVGTIAGSNVVAAAKTDDKNPAKKDNSNKKITAEEAGPPSINPEIFPTAKNPDTKKTEVVKPKKEAANTVKEDKKETVEPKMTGNPEKDLKGGTFKTLFQSQNTNTDAIEVEAVAGVFKSTSGWKDGKYYCLYSSAPPGTIIKVTLIENGKFIYAKVLDAIPDIKQNNNLQIIISNAAAGVLGVSVTNFNCTLSYSK